MHEANQSKGCKGYKQEIIMEGGNIMNYSYEVTISLPYTNKVLYKSCNNIVEAFNVWETFKLFAGKNEVISLNVYLGGTLVRSYVARF